MSTVGTSATLGGLVDLDVLDDEVAGVKTLGVGVGLGVLQQSEQLLSRLNGPASLGDTECLACITLESSHFKIPGRMNSNSAFSFIPASTPSSSILHRIDYHGRKKTVTLTLGSATGGTGISAHGNGLLVIDDILEVDESTL